jgi:nucleotide-binding universal stress UspA family protein
MSPTEPPPGATPTTPSSSSPEDPDVIREEIAQTREELGETMAALSEKTDVKAQASAKAEELKAKAQEVTDTARTQARDNPMPLVLAAAGALVAIGVLRKLRRRRRDARLERLAAELAQRTVLVRTNPQLTATA